LEAQQTISAGAKQFSLSHQQIVKGTKVTTLILKENDVIKRKFDLGGVRLCKFCLSFNFLLTISWAALTVILQSGQ
jgi:hypothetical protein